jgi:hypothetical protein
MMHLSITLIATIAAVAAVGGLALAVRFWRKRPDSYFVRWLSDDQIVALSQASIPLAQTVNPDGEAGFLFDARYLRRVLGLLDGKVVATFAWAQSETKVSEAVLKHRHQRRRFGVTLNGRAARGIWRSLLAVRPLRRLRNLAADVVAPVVRTDVVVHTSWTAFTPKPVHDNKFHIFLCAAPADMGEAKMPDRLWGIPLEGKHKPYSMAPSGRGLSLYDERTGYFFGELIDNCFYVHPDLLEAQRDARDALATRIFQLVSKELVADKLVNEALDTMPVELLALSKPAPTGSVVSCDGFEGRPEDILKPLVASAFQGAIGKDVVVHAGGGTNLAPVKDGKYHIYLFCAPHGEPSTTAAQQVFGQKVSGSQKAFAPSGIGLPVADETGCVVAELGEDSMYVLQDIFRFGSRPETAALARVLLQAQSELLEGGKHVEQRLKSECEREIAWYIGRGYDSASCDPQIKYHREQVCRSLRTARLTEIEWYKLAAAPAEELGREYDDLVAIPKVLDVTVKKDELVVKTDTIFCLNPKTGLRHEIGQFEIRLDIKRCAVTWHNLTRQVPGHGGKYFNAPHVSGKGYACLGNTQDLFPMLLRKRQFASAIELAITFVESVNLDDAWGKYITNWPLAANQERGGRR